MSKRILVWFRNDLRLHDNEMLSEAIAKSDEILPVYIFDPRQFAETSFYTLKTGTTRAQFLIESVTDLKQSFHNYNGDLLALKGYPEELLPKLVSEYQINEVYHHREVASEETAISTAVEDALWKQKVNLKHFIGHTLYNKEDLPFPIKDIPDVFTQFKKKAERDAIVKPCVATPQQINFVNTELQTTVPTINELFGKELLPLSKSRFVGGETEALKHLHYFLHTGENIALSNVSVKKYQVVSMLSPWLSLGCISPREVYWKMKEAEANYGLKPYFNQIVLGLLCRDYFRFMFKKYGNRFFNPEGFSKAYQPILPLNNEALNNWKNAKTEQPLVNSIMQELNDTGYINNSSRQLVAVYLVYELKISWVLGAAYFEEKLIDYSPASNWGNWANMAGVGNDSKLTQSFNFEKQLKSIDPKGTYLQAVKA